MGFLDYGKNFLGQFSLLNRFNQWDDEADAQENANYGHDAGGYTQGTDQYGYGGAGQIMGGNRVNLKSINAPHFVEDRQRMLDKNGDWGSLVGQLQQQANGQGPSVAQDAYRGAQQDNVNALGSMSRGSSSPGAARQAMIQQGRSGQGMAAGLASARTNEQMAARDSLAKALSSREQLTQNLSDQQLRALQGNQQYNAQTVYGPNPAQGSRQAGVKGAIGFVGGMLGGGLGGG